MKNTEKEMTMMAAIACAITSITPVGVIYTLLGQPIYTVPTKAPAIIKKKIADGVKKRLV